MKRIIKRSSKLLIDALSVDINFLNEERCLSIIREFVRDMTNGAITIKDVDLSMTETGNNGFVLNIIREGNNILFNIYKREENFIVVDDSFDF